MFDVLAGGNWQRGGGKGARPKPYPRPNDKPNERRWGTPIPLDEARRRFAARDKAS